MVRSLRWCVSGVACLVALAACGEQRHGHSTSTSMSTTTRPATTPTSAPYRPIAGMPGVVDPDNIYAQITARDLQPRFASQPRLVIVPNGAANRVSIIDADTRQVIEEFRTGREPQHAVPSYDFSTVWILNNQGNTAIAVDPATGKPVATVDVEDPYNLYFTPDGRYSIVVAERYRRLDFHSPDLKAFEFSIETPGCEGINHGDWSVDGRYALFTCEFNGQIVKVDTVNHTVLGYLELGGMPQDLRAGPSGHTFYVADMMANGVHIVDGDNFRKIGFIPTGIGAHGLTIARDAQRLFVANRGTSEMPGRAQPGGPGSVSVVEFSTGKVVATIPVPDGGSPDMGNLNVAGNELWLSGRFDHEVYVFDVTRGRETFLTRIPVSTGPHGLAYMPQPGRYSLGHTGNTR